MLSSHLNRLIDRVHSFIDLRCPKEVPFVDAEKVKGEADHLLVSERAPSRQDKREEGPNQELGGDQEPNKYHSCHKQGAKVRIFLIVFVRY